MEALFSNIEQFLVKSINHASVSINVAVAWFTNHILLEELVKALERKVNVNVILLDDIINRNELALDFNSLIERGGHIFFSSEGKNMHNKFCIIDNHLLITGSYNWTYYAENKNWENIICINDPSIIRQYQEEFDNIKSKLKETTRYEHLELVESKTEAIIDNYEYIYEDIKYKSINLGVEYTNYLTAIKNNIAIQRIENSYKLPQIITPQIQLKTLASLGVRCIDPTGNNITMVFLITRGTIFPCKNSTTLVSSADNQTSIECETLIGENTDANKNRPIGKFLVDGYPPLPKGKAIMEVTYELYANKELHVIAINKNTGKVFSQNYKLNDFFI